MTNRPGPHQAISVDNPRDAFCAKLFDRLWETYRQRIPHVGAYEQIIADAGDTFVNDHIAFRTFATQTPMAGMISLSRIFEALGYQAAGCYHFVDKQLNALHFQHPNPQFPKLFISELKTWELSESARSIIARTLDSHRKPCSLETLVQLQNLSDADAPELLDACVTEIETLPWVPPEKVDVQEINEESQYAAWVLVHGYSVNHFTSLINSHQSEGLNNIEKTIAALKAAGVPMKPDIEGEPGSKLRQTATAAAVLDVPVCENGQSSTIEWSYAYFELAERGEIVDQQTGKKGRFEGFLGPQATNLFEMTRVQ